MVTIKEVAREAGVSVGTVSKVINGQYVRTLNQEQVEAAIKKLGYRVNTYARGLKAQQTYTAVVIVPDLLNPFFAGFVQETEGALAAAGYKMLLCISHCDTDTEIAYLNMAVQNKADGLITITYSDLDQYLDPALPVVSIDRTFSNSGCCVTGDNETGGVIAARQLIQRGCRKLIYIRSGSNRQGETLKRGEAFRKECIREGVEMTQKDFGESTTLNEKQIDEIQRFLEDNIKENKFLYDGIFTSSDIHGVVIKEKLVRMGIRIPEEVQIIGYDGVRTHQFGAYPVSSIAQPVEEMASVCVDRLLRMIGKEPVERKIVLPVCFVDGKTTIQITEKKKEKRKK